MHRLYRSSKRILYDFESSRGFFYLLVQLVVTVKGLVMSYVRLHFLLHEPHFFVLDWYLLLFLHLESFNNPPSVCHTGLGHHHHAEEIPRTWLFVLFFNYPWLLSIYPVSGNYWVFSLLCFFYCLITFVCIQLLSIEELAMINHMLPF